jgi:hypothetical protein
MGVALLQRPSQAVSTAQKTETDPPVTDKEDV